MEELLRTLAQSDYAVAWLIALNMPVYFLAGYAFFDSWDGVLMSLYYIIRPDAVSLAEGDYHDDRDYTMRMGWYLFLCVAMTISEYIFLQSRYGASVV